MTPNSPYDVPDGPRPASKKKRVQRACDVCRRRRIRCDLSDIAGAKCATCSAGDLDCTFKEDSSKRLFRKGYVESLENRLDTLERLLVEVTSDARRQDDGQQCKSSPPPSISISSMPLDSPSPAGSSSVLGVSLSSFPGSDASAHSGDEADLGSSDDEILQPMLVSRLERTSLDATERRFFGKSSNLELITRVLDALRDVDGGSPWEPGIIRTKEGKWAGNNYSRPIHWRSLPFELREMEADVRLYRFPPPDLFDKVVDAYFSESQQTYPLLHRPTFEHSLRQGLHLRNASFGAVTLLVCANGARYLDDSESRIFLPVDELYNRRARTEGREEVPRGPSAGWAWFNQVRLGGSNALGSTTLFEIQQHALAALFLFGASAINGAWTTAGVGLRLALVVGSHRRKVYSDVPEVEDEQWKRAFWTLYTIDRMLSYSVGIPAMIHDEDIDLDLPAECDDDFWEQSDGKLLFKQPEGLPSRISFFICFIKLQQILGFAMRTLYSPNKSRARMGFTGREWEERTISQLDSALNSWLDCLPPHLRWDPEPLDQIFFDQAAMLHTHYHEMRIMVHRQFLPTHRHPSTVSFPSLAICVNAGKVTSKVLASQLQRANGRPRPMQISCAMRSALVLLFDVLHSQRAGPVHDFAQRMAEIRTCMDVLKACESRWHGAGRLWDVIHGLAYLAEHRFNKAAKASNTGATGSVPDSNSSPPHLSVPNNADVLNMAYPGLNVFPDHIFYHENAQPQTAPSWQAPNSINPSQPPFLAMTDPAVYTADPSYLYRDLYSAGGRPFSFTAPVNDTLSNSGYETLHPDPAQIQTPVFEGSGAWNAPTAMAEEDWESYIMRAIG